MKKNRKKIRISGREILFKSPVEYGVVGIRGFPVYYITNTYENPDLNELLALDTETREYFLLETSEDFDYLYNKAIKWTFEIMDQLHKVELGEIEEKIKEVLNKQLKEYFEGKDE